MFISLKQMTINAYTDQFQEPCYLCALEESEAHDLTRYIRVHIRLDTRDNMNSAKKLKEHIMKLSVSMKDVVFTQSPWNTQPSEPLQLAT